MILTELTLPCSSMHIFASTSPLASPPPPCRTGTSPDSFVTAPAATTGVTFGLVSGGGSTLGGSTLGGSTLGGSTFGGSSFGGSCFGGSVVATSGVLST